jgi:hypothetical protein
MLTSAKRVILPFSICLNVVTILALVATFSSGGMLIANANSLQLPNCSTGNPDFSIKQFKSGFYTGVMQTTSDLAIKLATLKLQFTGTTPQNSHNSGILKSVTFQATPNSKQTVYSFDLTKGSVSTITHTPNLANFDVSATNSDGSDMVLITFFNGAFHGQQITGSFKIEGGQENGFIGTWSVQ